MTWRFSIRVGILLAMLTACVSPSRAQTRTTNLLNYGVNVHQTPMQSWGPGYGIYLGRGIFITAAHVAGHTWFTRPKVAIADVEYPTSVVKSGSFESVDLTLLSVDPARLPSRLALRRNSLCSRAPWPGQPVVTVIPEKVVPTSILSPAQIPKDMRTFSTAISDVAETGNSGSGVFDPEKKCLLGIISRKLSVYRINPETGKQELHDLGKYFVPASVIRSFMPSELSEIFQ